MPTNDVIQPLFKLLSNSIRYIAELERKLFSLKSTEPQALNFLEVHPATQRWWRQRETCKQCAHVIYSDTHAMRCGQGGIINVSEKMISSLKRRSLAHQAYCIDARSPDGFCGPDAEKFEPRPS